MQENLSDPLVHKPFLYFFCMLIKLFIRVENPPLLLDFFCIASLKHGNQITLPFADGFFLLFALI